MKQHKIRMCVALLLVGAMLNGYQASASDVHIHCNAPSLSEQHFVSDIAEDDESIYFRITDASTGYSTHIIELKASGSECYIYTPKEYGLSANTFIDMEPGDSGQLWTTLRGKGNHYYIALFGEGQLLAKQECESRPAIGKSGAGWESENGFLFWDGTQTMALPYSSESESIGAFAVWNGGLAYADWENGIIWFVGAGAQNEEIFTLPEGQGFTYASLESVGDKLFLSYSADTGANDVRNTGLIELSAGRRLSEELRYIIQGRAQSDGSIQLMLTNIWPGNISIYYQGSVTEDNYSVREADTYYSTVGEAASQTDENGNPVGFHFVDSKGNQWIYHLRWAQERGAVSLVNQDGTLIQITGAGLHESSSVYWCGFGVTFDPSAYINSYGSMMVPVRGLGCLLGLDVTWDSAAREVTLHSADTSITLAVGSDFAAVNGKLHPLGTDVIIQDGYTMVPIRFICETFGYDVLWENGAAYIAPLQ